MVLVKSSLVFCLRANNNCNFCMEHSGFNLCVDGEGFPCFHIHPIIDVSSIPRMVFAGAALSCKIFILRQTSSIFSTKSFSMLPPTYMLSAHFTIFLCIMSQRLGQSGLLGILRYQVILEEVLCILRSLHLSGCKDG